MESGALNCTENQFGAVTHTCPSGRVVSLTCKGFEDSLPYSCGYTNVTNCGVWNGRTWDDSACEAVAVSDYEVDCRCYGLSSMGGSSQTELLLDFASVSEVIYNEFWQPQSDDSLDLRHVGRSVSVFIAMGVIVYAAAFLCFMGWRQDRRDALATTKLKDTLTGTLRATKSERKLVIAQALGSSSKAMRATQQLEEASIVDRSLPEWARAKSFFELTAKEMSKRHVRLPRNVAQHMHGSWAPLSDPSCVFWS
jgi:hypothetical protein